MSDIERTAELCPESGQPQDATKGPELDQAVRRHLCYEPSTGRLYWLKRAGGRTVSGQEAGSIKSDGYRKVTLMGRLIPAQNIAWFLTHGQWPEVVVDHIDCDPLNNRITNLREANHAENTWNTRAKRTNKLGTKGVSICKQTSLYRAQIHKSGKSIHLGRFRTKQEAATAYANASARLFGQFGRAM